MNMFHLNKMQFYVPYKAILGQRRGCNIWIKHNYVILDPTVSISLCAHWMLGKEWCWGCDHPTLRPLMISVLKTLCLRKYMWYVDEIACKSEKGRGALMIFSILEQTSFFQIPIAIALVQVCIRSLIIVNSLLIGPMSNLICLQNFLQICCKSEIV